jgi:3-isopropylmalate/(R)-2-methylmalate dehydratase small subunit
LKRCLLEGLDDIGQTLQKDAKIGDYESQQRLQQPWLYKAAS